ncbi:hypothetical protein AB1K56_08130 [Microbacterium sp. BWR-S6Y]|uniref:hypothetical protein n=1 Tax=Microbacterium sp. BWR-S6Y TaxID=3232073 RepID=UPI003529B62A
MAITRQRQLPPEAFLNPQLLALSPAVRLTEIGLRMYADNFGREQAISRLLVASIYPMDREMSESTIDEHLLQLADAGVIAVYAAGPRRETFYQFVEWPAVSHAGRSKHPEPPEDFRNHSGTVPGEGVRGREGAGESGPGLTPSGTVPDPDAPPAPFCRAHLETLGTDEPCQPCGRARLARKFYDDQLFARRRAAEASDD